ncbi:hypothetical protein D8674_025413 [Pyrus ussuriensis x Pyrus communis]|uniref:Uncharacterized protein n=1 Tax=Pyrus ussuriensis x Pyrus communis TaxID=2448454 RepID=A0A5N5HAM2_9ROSA|nr:hypothetical protein D8674_025413 [Pyrus ussuriensis x Pyrus communis]
MVPEMSKRGTLPNARLGLRKGLDSRCAESAGFSVCGKCALYDAMDGHTPRGVKRGTLPDALDVHVFQIPESGAPPVALDGHASRCAKMGTIPDARKRGTLPRCETLARFSRRMKLACFLMRENVALFEARKQALFLMCEKVARFLMRKKGTLPDTLEGALLEVLNGHASQGATLHEEGHASRGTVWGALLEVWKEAHSKMRCGGPLPDAQNGHVFRDVKRVRYPMRGNGHASRGAESGTLPDARGGAHFSRH